MNREQRDALRRAGRRAATALPELADESYRRVAALLTDPVNAYVKARRGGAA